MGFGFYYPSQALREMCSGNIQDSLNLHYNQAYWDTLTRPSLFMVPAMRYDSFNLYPASNDSLDYLTNPWYAIYQTQWQYMNNGGLFGNNWVLGGGNMFGPNMPGPNVRTPEKEKTAEELETERINKAYQNKLDKLYGLLNQVAMFHYDIESKEDGENNTEYTSLIETFDAIKNNRKLSDQQNYEKLNNQEKYEKLKEYYDKFKAEGVIADFLVNTKTMATNSGKAVLENEANNLHKNLIKIGYEKNTDDDVAYGSIIKTIKNLDDSNANPNGDNATASLENIQSQDYNVLDVISSINSINAKNGENASLIAMLVNKRNNLKETMRGNLDNTIGSLKEQLVREARSVCRSSGLDNKSKEAFENVIDELGSYDEIDNTLIEKFDRVYTYTRVIAAMSLSKGLKSAFGEIDPELFTENLFLNKTHMNTEEDLLEENMNISYIEDAGSLNFKNGGSRSDYKVNTEKKGKANGSENGGDSDKVHTSKSSMNETEAIEKGKEVHKRLRGYSEDEDYFEIDRSLSNLNSDNIIGFMDGFYSVFGHEGLIEYCDDEYDDGAIKTANKRNAIKAMLDRAYKHPELRDSYAYIKLKEISQKQTFDGGHKFTLGSIGRGCVVGTAGTIAAFAAACVFSGPVGWATLACGVGAAIWTACDRETDNERADQYMKTLYDEIKRLEAK